MSPHAQYARYIVRHKWFVLRAGLKTGAPLWRLLIHDWSKLTPAEWAPYVDSFYRDRFAPDLQQRFDAAWLHHQHHNPHHWQHWVLREDDGGTRLVPMPPALVREMVADWAGAGRAITGGWDVMKWYLANRDKMLIGYKTRLHVEYLLKKEFS